MTGWSTRFSEARARQVLRAAGLPFRRPLESASSTHNEIFLTDREVVRISPDHHQRLSREAALYAFLPEQRWTPRILATGDYQGAEYLIVERKPGVPLAHRWADLDKRQRRYVVGDLARWLRQLHETPTPPADDVPIPPESPQLLGTTDGWTVAPLLAGLDRIGADPNADGALVAFAIEYVEANASCLDPFPQHGLIHGDLTFENLLWDGHRLSGLIDFEWCRGGPADLDLDVLLRCCAHPALHISPQHAGSAHRADYAAVPAWLAESYPELFSHPNLMERLTLYAIAFEVALLLIEPMPADRRSLDEHHPSNRLVDLLSTGGHLAELLGPIGVRHC